MEPTIDSNDEKKVRRGWAEAFDRVWSQALIAVSTAEEEAIRVVNRVSGLAGWSQDEMKRQGRELADRLSQQRYDLERNVEDGVRSALERFKVPRRDDVQALASRLDGLSRRIDALAEKS
jgi:polyhydroxyalkanoate synthesis regulator phasin